MLLLVQMLLSGCATKQVEYIEVPRPERVKLPHKLLLPCTPPILATGATYGDVVLYADALLNTIDKCNKDKKLIQQLDNKY